MLKPLLGGKTEPDPADVAAAEKCVAEDLPKFWDYLEREIGDHEYFVGGRLTIADISVASPFVNLRHAGFAPERKRWPKLRAFLDRMHGRPSFKALIEQEGAVQQARRRWSRTDDASVVDGGQTKTFAHPTACVAGRAPRGRARRAARCRARERSPKRVRLPKS